MRSANDGANAVPLCGGIIAPSQIPDVRKIVENTAFGNFARPQPSFQLVHFLHRLPTRYSP